MTSTNLHLLPARRPLRLLPQRIRPVEVRVMETAAAGRVVDPVSVRTADQAATQVMADQVGRAIHLVGRV